VDEEEEEVPILDLSLGWIEILIPEPRLIFFSPAGLTGKETLNSFLLDDATDDLSEEGDTFPCVSRSACNCDPDAGNCGLERLEKLGKLKERDCPVDT
jgi:hypothetical protein